MMEMVSNLLRITDIDKTSATMKKGDSKLLIRNFRKMKEQETEKQALDLSNVSKRFFVCEDINYLNEMKVISTEFDSWKDADSFRQTMKEGQLYKGKNLLIINVC